jgi:hypothetical protein
LKALVQEYFQSLTNKLSLDRSPRAH